MGMAARMGMRAMPATLTRIFHKISVAPANLTPYQALCLPADFDVY